MTQKSKSSKRSTGIKKVADIKTPEGFKRSLKDFLADEDGFVKKETILKIGLATVSGVGMLGAMTEFSSAGHSNHPNHENAFTMPGRLEGICRVFDPTHQNLPTHTSHSSY